MKENSALRAILSGQFWVNALTPRWGHVRHADIAYGDRARQRLDIYVPKKPAPGEPVIVFFYGGSWQEGEKKGYRFVGQALASRGITAVVPDYGLYPAVRFPVFVEDAAAAVAWTKRHIVAYGGSPQRLFVAGHSAGAYNAAMVALDPQWLAASDDSPSDLAGVVGLSGPYDFLPITDPILQRIFAPKSRWPQTQPIEFVRPGKTPPMLLMHGEADRTVALKNSRNLAEELRASGGKVKLKTYSGINHVMLIAVFAAALRMRCDALAEVAAFVNEPDSESLHSG